ncbi:MAG TPA: hypothetical protein VH639_05015 [Bryobacteraceae bacterium]|jgi:hypothetical protein
MKVAVSTAKNGGARAFSQTRARLAVECAKPDPKEEIALAEQGLAASRETWPAYTRGNSAEALDSCENGQQRARPILNDDVFMRAAPPSLRRNSKGTSLTLSLTL